jgi:hypothetical protein
MKKSFFFLLVLVISFYIIDEIAATENLPLPGRVNHDDIGWIQFGSTDVFFYMTPEKDALSRKIVEEINQEKITLTIDINDYDCLTTEISAIASKYPNPLDYKEENPIFADPIGQATLESYAESLKRLLASQLGLNIEAVSREINFIVSQDAHKFHQDQSGNQFDFLRKREQSLPPCNIIQDLTLIDWDMSMDTFSATIVQDSLSTDRFLLTLFPKEAVGMLFTQSPIYLTREAHPSYLVPTIFPYHAVLSPIDKKGESTTGSSKGKRLSTVLRGVVLQSEIAQLKQKSLPLPINRSIPFEDEKGRGSIYQNGIVTRELTRDIQDLLREWNFEEGLVYKHSDRENVEILEIANPNSLILSQLLAEQFGISPQTISRTTFLRLIKKDGGFSAFNQMGLEAMSNSEVIILNSSQMPLGYDYFSLAEDCTQQMLPWIQLYHFPPQRAFRIPNSVFPKLSLTPVEEILFRKAEIDSMKTDGITAKKKIVTKIDMIIFEKKVQN